MRVMRARCGRRTQPLIAVEPAINDRTLRCGMRIENNYLVTDAGLELLSPFPLDLALA